MEDSNSKNSNKTKTSLPLKIRKEGIVLETLPSLKFKVKLDDGKEILAHLAGRLRIYRIKILAGDKVTVEMTPYDENRGRIVYRGK